MVSHIEYEEQPIFDSHKVEKDGKEEEVKNKLMKVFNDHYGTNLGAEKVYSKWKATELEKNVLGEPRLVAHGN